MVKSLFRSATFQSLLGWLMARYMDLVARTTRYEIEGEDHLRSLWEGDEGFILAFWHSRIAMMPVINRKVQKSWARNDRVPSIIVSMSKDGEFVARAAQMLGMIPIRGSAANKKKSKDKGGVAALRQANTLLSEGACVSVTPDGPRGPREHASLGAIRIAQRANVPIVACGVAAGPAHRLNSWDRFMLPRPFARGKIVFAAPIQAPKTADGEQLRVELEDVLRDVTERADKAVGIASLPYATKPMSTDTVESTPS